MDVALPPRNSRQKSVRRFRQRGAAMLEMGIASLALVPLMVGIISVGLGVTRYQQTSSVCRSAASMFVRGVDFTRTANQQILGKVAEGLGMTAQNGTILPSGRGVVILSVLMRIGNPECLAGGFPVGDGRCTNRGKVVVVRRIVVGNRNLRASAYGSPTRTPTSDGSFSSTNYLVETAFQSSPFGTAGSDGATVSTAPIHLAAGEITYLSESYFTAPELNLFRHVLPIAGFYHRNFF